MKIHAWGLTTFGYILIPKSVNGLSREKHCKIMHIFKTFFQTEFLSKSLNSVSLMRR